VIVVPSWIQRAVERGIVTSRYPDRAATADEVPATGRGPCPPHGSEGLRPGAGDCPVEAISPDGVDQGRCIRCARCLPAGFAFSGPVEASVAVRAELISPTLVPAASRRESAPLRPLGCSLHVFLVDVGSCNACNLEVMALANPYYDVSRLGVFFTNSPRHADVLLVVGVPTPEMVEPLKRAFEAMPDPKAVVAVGACPISGGAFAGTPGLAAGLSELIPVDRFVPGCPPPPVAVIDAIVALGGRARAPEEG